MTGPEFARRVASLCGGIVGGGCTDPEVAAILAEARERMAVANDRRTQRRESSERRKRVQAMAEAELRRGRIL